MQTGRKILNLRCDRKVSQQDLAGLCDITPSALSKIEAGINSPRALIIWKIAHQLGVTVEYLMDEGIPYPYSGYSYRQELYEKNVDPEVMTSTKVTREEKAFLDDLRSGNRIPREIAYAVPSAPLEVLRIMHFLLHNAAISPNLLGQFEKLVAGPKKRKAVGAKTETVKRPGTTQSQKAMRRRRSS